MQLADSGQAFACGHCGSRHFSDPPDAGGIRILGDAPDAPPCPLCHAPLTHALLEGTHPVRICRECRGLLLPRETFAGVVNKRRAWATNPPLEPVPLDAGLLSRQVACPVCSRPFDTHPNYGPGNVVIDSCTHCDLVWLDFGELNRIVDAPGRDRGTRQLTRIDDDYVRFGPIPDSEPAKQVDPLTALFDLLFRG